jgi:hypothetical protein
MQLAAQAQRAQRRKLAAVPREVFLEVMLVDLQQAAEWKVLGRGTASSANVSATASGKRA